MKKLFLVLIFISITGASLFAWEPQDLTKFPLGMDSKSWILNLGMGLPSVSEQGKDFISIPPMRLSLDRNVEMGDNKLPFFIGGIFGYSGWGYTGREWNYDEGKWQDKKYFFHDLSFGVRFGYHFNWDVKNLDTYAVTTAGWTIHSGDYYINTPKDPGVLYYGVNIGARYFLNNWFGFWVEAGYNALSFLDIGLSFKF